MPKPGVAIPLGSAWGMSWDCPSGIRHGGGVKLNLALVWNVRTWPAMRREKAQVAQTARPKVPMRPERGGLLRISDEAGKCPWSEGSGLSPLTRVNRQREEPDVQWKAAAFVRWHEPDDARVSSPDLVQRG